MQKIRPLTPFSPRSVPFRGRLRRFGVRPKRSVQPNRDRGPGEGSEDRDSGGRAVLTTTWGCPAAIRAYCGDL